MKISLVFFGALVALLTAGCQNPEVSVGAPPPGAVNSVTVSINQTPARSGLISVGTAALKADVYDIILYNAVNTYRIVVSTNGGSAILTNVVPATYALLVMAGKSNGVTNLNGHPAAIVLGSGDIPWTPGNGFSGTGVTTLGVSPTDGRGVTVAASGNTAVNVTLQNLIYSITSTGSVGSNPFTVGIGTNFTVDFSYDLFLVQTSATPSNPAVVSSPLIYWPELGSPFKVTGASSSFVSSLVTGSTTIHPLTIQGTFTAPETSGSSVFSLDNGSTLGINSHGMVYFVNTFQGQSGSWFSDLPPPQSGLAYNWYLPSDGLTEAMPAITDSVTNLAVPGSATVNFSAPGSAVTIGWGAGR